MLEKELYIKSTNNKDLLHTVVWMPEKDIQVKAVVQLSHGMIEHIKRYSRFAQYLTKHGYVVVGNDHLGHGKTASSEEELGYMDDFDASRTMVRDLHRVTRYIKKKFPDVPFYLLGHSMGSFLARRYAMMYPSELDGLMILGSAYHPKVILLSAYTILWAVKVCKGERYRSKLVKNFMFSTYNLKFRKESSENAWVTGDAKELEKYDADPFCTFSFTVKGYQTLLDTLLYIQKKEHIEKIPKDLPILSLAGKDDPVGSYSYGIKKVLGDYRKAGIKNIQSIFYKNVRHEVLNDLQYEKAQKDILDWLEDRNGKENRG